MQSTTRKQAEPSALSVEVPVFSAVGAFDAFGFQYALPSDMSGVSEALGVPDDLRNPRNRLKGPVVIQPKKPASSDATAITAAVQERVAAIIA